MGFFFLLRIVRLQLDLQPSLLYLAVPHLEALFLRRLDRHYHACVLFLGDAFRPLESFEAADHRSAPARHGILQGHPRLVAHEPLEMIRAVELAVETRRRDLEDVPALAEIHHVEVRRDQLRDVFTIGESDAFFRLVEEQAERSALQLGVPQLATGSPGDRLDLRADLGEPSGGQAARPPRRLRGRRLTGAFGAALSHRPPLGLEAPAARYNKKSGQNMPTPYRPVAGRGKLAAAQYRTPEVIPSTSC